MLNSREELEESFELASQQIKEHIKIIQVYQERVNALRDWQFYCNEKLKDLKIYKIIFDGLKDDTRGTL